MALRVKNPRLNALSHAERSLAVACTRGREAFVSRFRDLLHAENLTEQQWRALFILADEGPMIGSELNRLTCIHKASMTRIVAGLEKVGYVTRSPSPSDARASLLALSPAGSAMMERVMPEVDAIYQGIISDFGEERYLQLLSLLKDLADINR